MFAFVNGERSVFSAYISGLFVAKNNNNNSFPRVPALDIQLDFMTEF